MTKDAPLDPAGLVLARIGKGDFTAGVALVCQITGRDESNVRRWTYAKDRQGGTGGHIPFEAGMLLLRWAALKRVRLTYEDIWGNPEPQRRKRKAA